MVAGTVIGREPELATLSAFLTDGPRPGALVLEGEAGIGKTTLWRAALDLARAGGQRVLSCRPAAAEAQLSFAGLSDLLAPVLEDAAPSLPAPQRRALEVALLVEDADGAPPDVRVLAAAFLGVLREVAPVTLAIDDLQWLDAPSASVLGFAFRRLEGDRVAVLVARRGDGAGPPPFDFAPLERVLVEPMSMGALHHLLHTRLGIGFSRPVLRRLHDSSGGNPFYALELGRALQRRGGAPAPDQPLPVPDSLQRLVAERLAALPDAVGEVLALVAGLLDPRLPVVRELAPTSGAIDEAVSAGVLEVAGERLAFTHPLLASAVYGELGPERRRALHERLAASTVGEEEHALHLALATEKPDAGVAAELARAADRAAARGAPETGGRLAEHAARLTPDAAWEDGGRRAMAAAERYTAAGDPGHARAILDGLTARCEPGPVRAAALSLKGWVNLGDVDIAVAAALQEEALAEAGGDDRIESETRLRLAVIELLRKRLAASLIHAQAAVAAAERAGARPLHASALAQVGYVRALMGEGLVAETWRAVELERELPGFMGIHSPALGLASVLAWSGRFEEARAVLISPTPATRSRRSWRSATSIAPRFSSAISKSSQRSPTGRGPGRSPRAGAGCSSPPAGISTGRG